jgi:uncharacterized damage-inducible protein DinB
MKTRTIVLAAGVIVALSAPARAQAPQPLTAAVRPQLSAVTGFVVRAAEKIPEDLYSFRATPEVRSVGQLFGHIADALFAMCSAAGGGKPPRAGVEQGVQGKANLVRALNEGVAYCESVVAGMNDTKGTETVPFYFGPTPRLSVLYFVVAHTYEHYGNLVTYMRLKGIVPPSSETPQ